MGQRVTQRILECMECNEIPEDGEYLWEMGRGYMCRPCCDAEDNEDEYEDLKAVMQDEK